MNRHMYAIPMAIVLAGIIAMSGAFFGAITARALWAEDLHHARELRKIWDQTEATYKEHISILERHVGALEKQAAGTPH